MKKDKEMIRLFFVLPTICTKSEDKDDINISVPEILTPLLEKFNASHFNYQKINKNLAVLLPAMDKHGKN